MAGAIATISSEDAGIQWTMPLAARERNKIEAKKFVRHAAFHILLHAIAYVLIFSLATHFLMPSVFSIKASMVFTLHLLFRSWPTSLAFIPVFGLILWGFYRLRLLPIAYEVSNAGAAWKDWSGRHFYDWRRLKAYRIETDPKWPKLRLLKLKSGATFGREWPFDPVEIDEQQIRRLFEEHGIPDAGAGPWFGRKR